MHLAGRQLLLCMVLYTVLQGRIRGGGGAGCAPPPKIGKNMIVLVYNRDFSHEIPQHFSRFPPQLEKI